jgi:hypothetical protein
MHSAINEDELFPIQAAVIPPAQAAAALGGAVVRPFRWKAREHSEALSISVNGLART